MKDRSQEIYEAREKLVKLLGIGKTLIEGVRVSGDLQSEVKGRFETGETDDITRADKVVRDTYFNWMKAEFPQWKILIEDKQETYCPQLQEGDIGVFFDPLDSSKALRAGEYGPSTMAAIGVQTPKGFHTVFGIVNILDGPMIWGFDDGRGYQSNVPILRTKIKHKRFVLGKSPVERNKSFEEKANAVQRELPCEFSLRRGLAGNAEAFVKGETSGFIYGNINFWDALPIIPIINAHNGETYDFQGNPITYQGEHRLKNGFLATRKGSPRKKILEIIATSR